MHHDLFLYTLWQYTQCVRWIQQETKKNSSSCFHRFILIKIREKLQIRFRKRITRFVFLTLFPLRSSVVKPCKNTPYSTSTCHVSLGVGGDVSEEILTHEDCLCLSVQGLITPDSEWPKPVVSFCVHAATSSFTFMSALVFLEHLLGCFHHCSLTSSRTGLGDSVACFSIMLFLFAWLIRLSFTTFFSAALLLKKCFVPFFHYFHACFALHNMK